MELEEVVVTARGREERLQDVPIQVNVVSNEAIKNQGLKDVLELTRLAPSFNYQATQRGQGTISMRGLNPNTFNTFRQGVSFFVDGIYIPGEVTSLNLQDLQRVEVLKGPQATQFGRGTYAGAVNYVTRTPSSNEFEGRLDAEVSSYDSHDVNGFISFPIVNDRLFAEVSARHYERGSRYVNRNDGKGVGGQESLNLAGILHWQPTESTSIKLRHSYDDDDDDSPAQFTLFKQDTPQALRTFPTGATYPVFTLDFRRPETIGYGDSLFDGYGDRDGNRLRRRDVTSLIASHRFAGDYEIRYSGNVFSERTVFNSDIGNRWLADPSLVNAQPVLISQGQDFDAMSHEIRLNSPAGERLTWTLGANYYEIDYDQFAPGILNFFPAVSYTVVPGISKSFGTFTNREIAGFASVSYEIFDRTRLTLEGRHQTVRLSYDRCPTTQCLFRTGEFAQTEDDFLPRVTLDFQLDDRTLLYGLVSKGVKNGAVNTTQTAATEAAFTAFVTANYQRPEQATNYEVGFKTSTEDGALELNGAAYYIEVKDQQVTTFLPSAGTFLLVTANGGTSEIEGAELTATARLTPDWTLSGGLGYANHEFTSPTATNSILVGLYGINDPRSSLRGLTSVLTPEWSGNASTEYRIPFGADSEIALRADYQYTGEQYVDVPNLITLPEIHRLGLSAQYTRGDTSVTLFAKNVLNDKDPADAAIGSGNLTEVGTPRYFQQPSTLAYLPYGTIIGLRLSQRF